MGPGKNVLNESLEDTITEVMKDLRLCSKTAYQILNCVNPQLASPSMHVFRLSPACSEKEVSELCHYDSKCMVVTAPWRKV